MAGPCGRCGVRVVDGEVCWWCHGQLCYSCWEVSVQLSTGVTIEIFTASYRTGRGYTCVGLVCDEVAFWYNDDEGANPDAEILTALRPAMATVPDALLLGLSTPYAQRGQVAEWITSRFTCRDGGGPRRPRAA